MSALAPCALGKDQPHAYLSEGKPREAFEDQIRSPLLVLHTVVEQLRPDLDHDIQVAHIQLRLLSEPDLYVTRSRRSDPGFLRAVDRFGDNIWQYLSKVMKSLITHCFVIKYVNYRHATSIAELRRSGRAFAHRDYDNHVERPEPGSEALPKIMPW